jgi:hypothetical protein
MMNAMIGKGIVHNIMFAVAMYKLISIKNQLNMEEVKQNH